MKRILALLSFVLALNEVHAQQDPLYSQYMQNPLVINPGYTGTYNMMSLTGISRWQWVGMQGVPQTNTATGHTSFMNNKLGAGIILVNDRFGISNNTEAHATFAYKLRLSDNDDHVLSFGMQAGLINHSFNYADLTLKNDNDASFVTGRQNTTDPNFGAGLFYRNEKMFAGISAPKILNTKFEDGNSTPIQYRRHLFLTAGYLIDLNSVQLKPSFLLKYVDGAPVSLDVNASILLKEKLWLGGSIRNLNSAVLMAQLQLNDMLRLGYSFDLPLNNIVKTTFGTHELMLNVDLKLLRSHDIGMRYF